MSTADEGEVERTSLSKQQQEDLAAFFYHSGWRYPEEMRKIWAKAMLSGAIKAVAEGPPEKDSSPKPPPAARYKPISEGQVGSTRYTIYG